MSVTVINKDCVDDFNNLQVWIEDPENVEVSHTDFVCTYNDGGFESLYMETAGQLYNQYT